jgi:hypothetical protein
MWTCRTCATKHKPREMETHLDVAGFCFYCQWCCRRNALIHSQSTPRLQLVQPQRH